MKLSNKFGIVSLLLVTAVGCGAGSSDSCPDGECLGTQSAALATSNDLTIAYIQRLPVMSWVENSTNATRDGWPSVGQSVTWHGVLKNFSASARSNVQYKWTLDGTQVATGQVSLAANGTASVDLVRAWDFNRHSLKLSIDTNNAVAEDEELNNDLTVTTDAISLGLWVEQSLYNYFLAHQRELVGAHSTSWENWAQRQVSRWNDVLYAGAIYPDTPNGVLDRVRLDKITIVPDGALPLPGGTYATNDPDVADHTVDLEWGYPSSLINGYSNTTSATLSNPFYYEDSLPHELGHARYLIDNYGFNVHQQPDGLGRDVVPQTENGAKVVGTPFMPMQSPDVVYYGHQNGLMNTDHTYMDAYSARALNLIAGRRATQGNRNAPGNIGVFLNDLPAQNQLALVDDATGAPLVGAQVSIYQSTAGGVLYAKVFSPTPAQVLTTDGTGKIALGHNPFTSGSLDYTHGSTVVLLRVLHQNRVRYVFMEASDFNMEAWRGHTTGNYTLRVAFLPGGVLNLNPILGFESLSSWSTNVGTLARVTSPITQGAAALQISGIGYATLTSGALTSQDVSVGSSVSVDLLLPAQQPTSWHGTVQIFLTCPSRNVYNASLGTVNLDGLPLETYNTINMAIPAWLKTSLTGASFSDLKVSIALNAAVGSGRHLLDNFRFVP